MTSVNNTNSSSKVAYSYLQHKNKISGLVSGMDIDSIMEKLMKAESAQMEKLQQQKQKYEWKRDAYREVNTTLTSFQQGLFDNYGKNSNWNSKTVNVSPSNAISVIATPNANGNLSITGSQQATSANNNYNSGNVKQVRVTEDTKLGTIQGLDVANLNIFGQTFTTDNSLKDVINVLDTKGYQASIYNGKLSISAKDNATPFADDTEQSNTIASLNQLGFNAKTNQQSSKLTLVSDGTTATTSSKLSDLGVSADGTMKITVGGEVKQVAYTKDDTLSSFMTKINKETGLSVGLADGVITLSSSDKKSIVVDGASSPISFSNKVVPLQINQKSSQLKLADGTVATGTVKMSELVGVSSPGTMTFTVNGATKEVSYNADDTLDSVLSKINKETGLNATLKDGSITLSSSSNAQFSVDSSPFTFNNVLGSLSGDTIYSSDVSSAGTALKGSNTVGELLGTNSTNTNKFTLRAIKEDGTTKDTTIEFKNTDTIDSIISKINSSGAGVTAIFNNGQLNISANNTGTRDGDKAEVSLLADKNVGQGNALFTALGVTGITDTAEEVSLADGGTNAKLTVNGVTYEQKSNIFNIAGYTITATGDLGSYADDGTFTPGTAVTVSSTTNADSIVDKVKEFVDTYNGFIKDLNTRVTQKKNVTYSPLTDAQKAEMTTDEIAKWEEKAKAGLLKGDPSINSALSSMRTDLSQYGGKTGDTLYNIGITTSKTWTENGKLEIDEDKLRAALEKDPEIVSRIFTGDSAAGQEGIVAKMRTASQTAVKNIEVTAGKATSISEKSYSLGRTISDLDTKISDWKDRLNDIEERYWNQFSAMEKAIQRANSQSSIFSQG
ncbi:flagellar filament capping protein FliD [Rummeliibacillus pycnus]|uniref:flagellar filament capping protein FliD n=1 Tax=Rummeliibacillus pycnus TaxID=101070 RepID=UPI003D285690